MLKPKKLTILNFIVLFAIFLGVYLAFASILNSKTMMLPILLRPDTGSVDNYDEALISGVKRTDVFIPTPDGKKMHAWLFAKPLATKIAIVSHGNAANVAYRLHIADALLNAGCSVLLYDYRGFGKSTGSATMDGILDDGITAYDYVRNVLHYEDNQIVLYGESIGSGVTCHIMSLRSCLGAIIQSGLSSIPSTAKAQISLLEAFPDFVFAQPQLANATILSKLHTPVLIIHGKQDHIVASRESTRLYAQANEPKTLILLEKCGHNDLGVDALELHTEYVTYTESIKNFVTSLDKSKKLAPVF